MDIETLILHPLRQIACIHPHKSEKVDLEFCVAENVISVVLETLDFCDVREGSSNDEL